MQAVKTERLATAVAAILSLPILWVAWQSWALGLHVHSLALLVVVGGLMAFRAVTHFAIPWVERQDNW